MSDMVVTWTWMIRKNCLKRESHDLMRLVPYKWDATHLFVLENVKEEKLGFESWAFLNLSQQNRKKKKKDVFTELRSEQVRQAGLEKIGTSAK